VTSGVRKIKSWGYIPVYTLLIGTVVLALIPHFSVLVTSLFDGWFMTVLPEQWTLDHYKAIFNTPLSAIGIKNSLLFAGLSTLFDLVLGLLVAYVVVRK